MIGERLIMKNTLLVSASLLALTFTSASAEYSDAGTAYSTAETNSWSEDSINDYVSMANSFACILANSRPDVLPNASYEALIGEVDCGLQDEKTNASGVSNRSTLSSAIIKNSRASNTSTQEGQVWFNAQDGKKFVAQIAMKRGPGTGAGKLEPYGEWGLAFYLNNFPNNGTEFTNNTSPSKGFVDIAEGTSSGSVVLRTFDQYRDSATDFGYQSARIEYSDGTLDSAKILGRSKGQDNGVDFDKLVAAKTNKTHVFRAVSNDGGTTFAGQCMKRTENWKTGHEYGVYNKSTGAKLAIAGGFGFNYTEGGSSYRGYLGSWGVHFENPATAFSPTSTTKTITAQNGGTQYTLSWAPGKLDERVEVPEALPTSGTSYFKAYIDNGVKADFRIVKNGAAYEGRYYNSAGNQVHTPFNGLTLSGNAGDRYVVTTDITANPWLGRVYSEEKRTDVVWDGTAQIKFLRDEEVSTDATLLAASFTPLVAVEKTSVDKNLPISAAWRLDNDPHSYPETNNDNDYDNYYFTGRTPPSGYLARTLYHDPTGNGPVVNETDDKAVMWDFSANEKAQTYTTFANTPTSGTLATNGNITPWPFKDVLLRNAGSTKIYRWRFGAFNWDNSIMAIKADNSIYSVEKPKVLEYVHATANDMNNGKTVNFYATTNNNPVPNMCPLNNSTPKVPYCTVTPSNFGTKKFYLRYDGNWLGGLPNTMARGAENDKNAFWIRMINPKAGTQVKDMADNTLYVLKPLGTGEAFLPETDATKCTNATLDSNGNTVPKISFASRAEFGWTLSQLPALADYPLPTQTWAAQPAKTSLSCTVTMGDASACN